MKPEILLDTGPLVALMDRSDQNHLRAREFFSNLSGPFVTCEAVLAEACFLVGKLNPCIPERVIRAGETQLYKIGFSLQDQFESVRSLLRKYADQRISLADACLIRCAELYEEPRILTFDSDFEVYRWGRNRKFERLG